MASGTDALQFIHRFSDIFHGHIAGKARCPNARRHDKPDLSTFEFFVVRQCVKNFLAREISRQLRWQLEPAQKIENCALLIRRQASFFSRDRASRDDSEAERFAVKEFPVISSTLDRVAHSVSEIENRALTRAIAFVS